MRALEIIWEILFCSFFSLFLIFFFCVKRRYGVSGHPDSAPVCPDGHSSCLDDTVDFSGGLFFLSGQACFCDLYVALRLDVI